jgi:hypothetical protein
MVSNDYFFLGGDFVGVQILQIVVPLSHIAAFLLTKIVFV